MAIATAVVWCSILGFASIILEVFGRMAVAVECVFYSLLLHALKFSNVVLNHLPCCVPWPLKGVYLRKTMLGNVNICILRDLRKFVEVLPTLILAAAVVGPNSHGFDRQSFGLGVVFHNVI